MHYGMNKKDHEIFIFSVSLSLLLVVLFAFFHPAKALQKLQFTAEVAHTRVIIVDMNFKILQIVSNTKKDVEPTVRINGENGPEIPLTESVLEQYQKIISTTDFPRIGIIYDSRRLTLFGIKLPDSVSRTFIFLQGLFTAFTFHK